MRLFLFAGLIVCLAACNNNSASDKAVAQSKTDTTKEKISFFPVTSYIKGQLYEIAEKGIFPVKYTTVKNHTDSVILKFDQLNDAMDEFLHPEIDTLNLIPFYSESKFLDQSINAFTFTYEPKSQLPDSLTLRHWDVYIVPETGKVSRIYMVKKLSANKLLQLTWLSNQWCKIITITNNPGGTEIIEKEEKISWAPHQS